ncbi:MAG: hypothetical protein O3A84_05580 [Proteobacteria bacterium]|nr:hypothetical protein [Pseudomonadota bacterium]
MIHENLQSFNKVLVRITWFFLTIGLIDHFAFEFLPPRWASWNLILLFSLIGLLIVSETVAFFLKRREASKY